MRFNRRNWIRFFDGHNKKTTIRLRKSRIGLTNAYAGSRRHPELLGTFYIDGIEEKRFDQLTPQDAIDDGFGNLKELLDELMLLNSQISPETKVYKHLISNVKATADNTDFKTASPKLKHS